MELSVYEIIKKRILTEKSDELFKKFGKLTFEVYKNANKVMIRNAIEKIWNVKVENVRVISCPGKAKSFGKKIFKTSGKKKAIITLKKGYKIDLPSHYETMGVSEGKAKKKQDVEGK
ncbi:50S ribosomal protein L23 [Candidatus Babeliales bacterium]|nr:50S ribosomal protein L23 [Candidatus Babeliales bacterium]